MTKYCLFNLDKEQMKKKSDHTFQSTEKNVTKDAQTENVLTDLSNAYASGMDVSNKCYLFHSFL